MNASDLRTLAKRHHPSVLEPIYEKMKEKAGAGEFCYRHYPDALPDFAIKELKKEGYKVTVVKGEYDSTDTTISWD